MADFGDSLRNSEKYLLNADHLVSVTFKFINDKKILLNVIENIYKSLLYGIDSILQYEAATKQARLFKESRKNMQLFKMIADTYSISQSEIRFIDEIFYITKKHKESSMEFLKNDKIVIMSDNLPYYLQLNTIRQYIENTKVIIGKIKKKISS
jgi:hypothetical protein